VVGDFTLKSSGLLTLDIAGLTPDLFSQLAIGGFGKFDGTIDFDFIDGFAPQMGEMFDLISVLDGADFSNAIFEISGLEPGFQYTATFSDGSFVLTADNDGVSTTTAPEPGTMGLLAGGLTALAFLRWRRGAKTARRSIRENLLKARASPPAGQNRLLRGECWQLTQLTPKPLRCKDKGPV
jgi:hypothetical protein